jgi:hypothetical protein
VTFDDWLEARPKEFWRKLLADKLAETFQAGRAEGWHEADRVQQLQYRMTSPRHRIPQEFDVVNR